MIEAYIDESGIHRGAPLLVVAAYFAPHSTWRAFNRDWQTILQQHNISCFHAKEGKCDVLRPYLAKIIQDCKLRGVVVTVPRSIYNQHASGHLTSKLGDAYAACVSQCVIKTCKLVKEHYQDKAVVFVIESGHPKAERLESGLKGMMEEHALDSDCAPIEGITLAKKEDFMALQTADFLSHVCSTSDLVWLNQLARRGRIYVVPISEDMLKGASTEVKRIAQQRKARRLQP